MDYFKYNYNLLYLVCGVYFYNHDSSPDVDISCNSATVFDVIVIKPDAYKTVQNSTAQTYGKENKSEIRHRRW